MELTQEMFDKMQADMAKLKEVSDNKDAALAEERAKRKELRTKLEEKENSTNEELEAFRQEKAKREEQEAKKKGKYEELLAEKDNKIAEMSELLPTLEAKATKFDDYLTKQLETKLEAIPEEKREFVTKVIDWKDYESKIELLDWFHKEYNPENKDFNNKPKWWSDWVSNDTTEYQKAKESWDVMSIIANAPAAE